MMDPARKRAWSLLTGVIAAGVGLALAILVRANSTTAVAGLPQAFFVALAFNALSFLARWLLTKSRRRMFLQGRFPLVVGLARLSGFIACATLVVALVVGMIAGPPLAQVTLAAFVTGLLLFATLSITATGILNAVVVVRHLRGTLAATSREGVGSA